MKKSVAFLLSLILVITSLLGCGGSNDSSVTETSQAEASQAEASQAESEESAQTQADDETVTKLYEWPLAEDGAELTIFTKLLTSIEDFDTNKTTLWYEEQTGVHINWIQAPEAEFTTQLNLNITGGEWPDIYAANLSTTELMSMRNGGVIIPLNDLIDTYAYYAHQILEEHPEYRDYLTAPDGNMYSLWYNDTGKHMYYTRKMFVKQSWLEQLGIEAPTTTQEFEDMLIAFRDNDMNGNGDTTDEVPFMSSFKAWGGSPFCYFICPFQMTSGDGIYADEDGTWHLAAAEDGYKEALTWMNHLFEEGLIAEETFTQDKNQFKAIINASSEEEAIVGCFTAAYQGEVINNGSYTQQADYVPVEPLEGPSGQKIAPSSGYGDFKARCAITSVCENPKIAIQWLDFWLSQDGRLYQEYGVEEGVDYQIVDKPSIYGSPTSYERLFELSQSTLQNIVWYNHTVPRHDWEEIRYGNALEDGSQETLLYEAALLYEDYYVPTGLKALFWIEDEVEAEEYDTLKTDINDYIETQSTAFTTGERSLDEFDMFVQELKDIGMDRYLELAGKFYGNSGVDYDGTIAG